MKFLNLETGYSFDAAWTNNQQRGYIFWFPNEQSIDLIYTMPIAIVTDNDTPLQLSIENNSVFSFANFNDDTTFVDGYKFDGCINYDNNDCLLNIETTPEEINGKFIHVFNVMCCSHTACEYICKLTIKSPNEDECYIRIGADFYSENEPVQINLSNMGVEIPTSVQKAIYDANVHEDVVDSILINRKFKELISNYWDIVANKGSYKSLKNSIEWFEWNDLLKIREIWKHNEANRIIFNDEDIMSVIDNKVESSMNNFIKTTYISLYCSLQEETDNYDIEYNPILAQAVLKWSRNDIQLKIALLAQFFGVYFMPIHMSILHAVAEDCVFTNTIKTICGSQIKRHDAFGDFNYVECNIIDNAIFKMSNVNVQVSDKTRYGIKYPSDDRFGVDIFPSDTKLDEESIKTFATQYYSGPGVIIPIKFVIPNQYAGDFIKQTVVDVLYDNNNKRFTFNDLIYTKRINKETNDRVFNIELNYLATQSSKYTVIFTFITASSKTITRKLQFTVEDADNLNINVYKIHAKDDVKGLTKNDFVDISSSKYMVKIQNGDIKPYYTQYLPYMTPDTVGYDKYNGIKLTRTVVIDLQNNNGLGHINSDKEILFVRAIMQNDYLEFAKYLVDDNGDYITDSNDKPIMSYLIFVSKKFYASIPNAIYNNVYGYKFNIIRNDLGFYPQFHYLEKMTGNTIDKYTISPYEAICCAAEINTQNGVEEFRYGNMINECEWSFYNHLTNKTVVHPVTARVPFAIKQIHDVMESGYYDISFKYSLTNGVTDECRLDSAFRIK